MLTSMYGSGFVQVYGDRPPSLWLSEIDKLTDDQVRAGISKLAHQPRDFPANLTQFVDACKSAPASPRYLGQRPALTYAERDELIPRKDRTSREFIGAHVDGCLASIRAKLASAKIQVAEEYRPAPATSPATGPHGHGAVDNSEKTPATPPASFPTPATFTPEDDQPALLGQNGPTAEPDGLTADQRARLDQRRQAAIDALFGDGGL